jgi:hypothetical protein
MLWRIVDRTWKPKGWRLTATEFAQEYWHEDLLLDKIFIGRRRFRKPSWWAKRIAVMTLPR